MTFQKIVDWEKIYERQQIVKQLFVCDEFPPGVAIFPRQVFRKAFDTHLFLTFNDWFDNSIDHQYLQSFVRLLGDKFYYADVPSCYLLNPVKFSVDCSHSDFVTGFNYALSDDRTNPQNLGLRLSPTSLIYSDSQTWAMASDLTHNIVIVGLEAKAVESFQTAFDGNYFDIHEVIRRLEEFMSVLSKDKATMDSTESLIQRYL
jgi:hypothetical protein